QRGFVEQGMRRRARDRDAADRAIGLDEDLEQDGARETSTARRRRVPERLQEAPSHGGQIATVLGSRRAAPWPARRHSGAAGSADGAGATGAGGAAGCQEAFGAALGWAEFRRVCRAEPAVALFAPPPAAAGGRSAASGASRSETASRSMRSTPGWVSPETRKNRIASTPPCATSEPSNVERWSLNHECSAIHRQ